MNFSFKIPPSLRLRSIAAVVLMVGWGTAPLWASTRAETLEAIHRVENPFDRTSPGKYGELGPYQFRRATWRMHTKQPFTRALERQMSDQVAILHYDWIARGLQRNGLPVTPYTIALAWNGGLSATVNGRAPRSARLYAERVRNLAAEGRGAQLAAMP